MSKATFGPQVLDHTDQSDKTVILENDIWEILNNYFATTPNFLTSNQLDSYNTFISAQIPKTLKQFNPIDLTQNGGGEAENTLKMVSSQSDNLVYLQRINITVGGSLQEIDKDHKIVVNDGSSIKIGKPVIQERIGDQEIRKQLFPNEARLRNLTYASMLSSDIYIEFIREDAETKQPIPLVEYENSLSLEKESVFGLDLGVTEETPIKTTYSLIKHFRDVPLGRLPVMLHSNICVLAGQHKTTLREMGECPYGQGGYFIINGKEKTIIAQERQMENKIFTTRELETSNYKFMTEVRSSPEHKFQPARLTKLVVLQSKQLQGMNQKNQYLYDLYGKGRLFIAIDDTVKVTEMGKGVYLETTEEGIAVKVKEGERIYLSGKNIYPKNTKLEKGNTIRFKIDLGEGIVKNKVDGHQYLVEFTGDRQGQTGTYDQNSLEFISHTTSKDTDLICGEVKKSETKGLKINENAIRVLIPNIEQEVPLFILYRALGLVSDQEIINQILGTSQDNKLTEKYHDMLLPSIMEARYVTSQQMALNVLKSLMNQVSLSETISETSEQLSNDLMETLTDYLLPHVGIDFKYKTCYLSYMVRETLDVMIGLKRTTDRDSYLVKRVDISGFLIAQLFRDLYFRLKNDIRDNINKSCSNLAREREGNVTLENNITLQNITNLVNYRLIDDGMMYAFRNCWGMKNSSSCKEGVVQDLDIISAFGTFSHLRRINTPIPKSAKMREPHSLHASSWGIMCPTETPDGGNVGIRKNLSLQSKITADCSSYPLEACLLDLGVVDIRGSQITNMDYKCYVSINDRLTGVHHNPIELVKQLRCLRQNGLINIYTSICWNIQEKMVKVATTSGRGCRPLFIVRNNKLKIVKQWIQRSQQSYLLVNLKGGEVNNYSISQKQAKTLTNASNEDIFTEHLQDILSLSREAVSQIEEIIIDGRSSWQILLTGWTRFVEPTTLFNFSSFKVKQSNLTEDSQNYICLSQPFSVLEKNAGVIEYLDVEEENSQFLAMSMADLSQERNRHYTHSEIHPSMILGILASIIPFVGSNQAPRNLFSNSQTKQAIGVFATNYRDRMDTKSQILLYPQIPIVDTRMGRYINTEQLPYGQNAIVAIACYSGYNQDDSVIISQSALDRGLFRTVKFRTYTESEQELPQGGRQFFCRPNPANMANLPAGNYNYLRSKGIYTGIVKEETKVDENDVIIGVCVSSNIKRQRSESLDDFISRQNQYLDNSTFIRRNESGIVDKVFIGLNIEGNKFCKVRVRKEKIPELGDKFASRHGQKGVIGMKIKQGDMPTTEQGITPDMIINPQAFPKRMTVGQFIECIMGKQSMLKGEFGDATPFVDIPREQIADELEKQGFEKYGNELMYNGMTGEQIDVPIFIGPTYYQRLYHQVDNKIYSRAEGAQSSLSHQPVGGRALGGGLRIGEMERDSLLSHGVASFLKESVMERSDKFNVWIDNRSGGTGIVNSQKHIYEAFESYKTVEGFNEELGLPQKVQIEPSVAGFSHIQVPYAFKLFSQEMIAMCIMPRLLTENQAKQWETPDVSTITQRSIEIEEGITYYSEDVANPEIRNLVKPMNYFHNQVKNILIAGATTKMGGSLIDFSCGRGGDISKWQSCKINDEWCNNYLGVDGGTILGFDISIGDIVECQRKFKEMKSDKQASKREWAKTADVHFFQRDTSLALYGENKRGLKYQNERLFPMVEGVQRHLLKTSKEGLYSITQPPEAVDIINILSLYLGNLKKMTITEAAGGIGGDSISFARNFGGVNTFELNPEHCDIIRHNLETYGLLGKVNLKCGDYLSSYLDVKQDAVYLDPPWGGKDYRDQDKLTLDFGGKPLVEIVSALGKRYKEGKSTAYRVKLVILKLPSNYDLSSLKRGLAGWTLKEYSINKFLIVVCLPKGGILTKQLKGKNLNYQSPQNILRKLGEHHFDIASSMFSIHYYFKTANTLKELLTNVMKSLKFQGFFLATCLDGESVYQQLKQVNAISGYVDGQELWSIKRPEGQEWIDFGEDFPADKRAYGRNIDVMVRTIRNDYITEPLVSPTLLINEASKYGLRLASDEVVNHYFKFLTSGTGNFYDILLNYLPRGIHNDLLNPKYSELLNFTKLNRYYIFQYRDDVTYPYLTFSLNQGQGSEACQHYLKHDRKYRKMSTNFQNPNFRQFFFTAANSSQLKSHLNNQRLLFGNNSLKSRNKNQKNIYQDPLAKHNINRLKNNVKRLLEHPVYQNINSSSFETTLDYMFNHLRTGIYVRIRAGAVVMFIPFVKSDYENTLAERYLQIDETLYPNGLRQYYSVKKMYYPERGENYDQILPKSQWFSNNCMVGNLVEPHQWDDHFFVEIKNMLEQLLYHRKHNIPDVEFFVNKRDFPNLKADLTEPYGDIYNSKTQPLPSRFSRPGTQFMPIFSYSGAPGFLDIPLPTPDDWIMSAGGILPPNCRHPPKIPEIPWEKKKPIAVFRGTSTGCGTNLELNQRLRMADISYRLEHRVTIGQTINIPEKQDGTPNDYPILNTDVSKITKDDQVFFINPLVPQGTEPNYQLGYFIGIDGEDILIEYNVVSPTIQGDFAIVDKTQVFQEQTAPFSGTVREVKIDYLILEVGSHHVRVPLGMGQSTPLLDAKLTKWNLRDRKNMGQDMTFLRGKTQGKNYRNCQDNSDVPAEFCDEEGNLKFNYAFDASDHYKLDYQQQAEYRYAIYIDGWAAAYRYSTMMRLGSTILKVESLYGFKLWFFDLLTPLNLDDILDLNTENGDRLLEEKMVDQPDHISIPADFDQAYLEKLLKWCNNHSDVCQQIAKNASIAYRNYLENNRILDYLEYTLNKVADNMTDETLPKLSGPVVEPILANSETLYLPEDKIGLIYGKRGLNMAKLQMKTNATITKVRSNQKIKDGVTYQGFTLQGTSEAIALAKQDLLEKSQFKHQEIIIPDRLLLFAAQVSENLGKPQWVLSEWGESLKISLGLDLSSEINKVGLKSVLDAVFTKTSSLGLLEIAEKQLHDKQVIEVNMLEKGETKVNILVIKSDARIEFYFTDVAKNIMALKTNLASNLGVFMELGPDAKSVTIWGSATNLVPANQLVQTAKTNIFSPSLVVENIIGQLYDVPEVIPTTPYLQLETERAKKIAIIVPFRNGDSGPSLKTNRDLQLERFIRHLEEFFRTGDKNQQYTVFVIEQQDSQETIQSVPNIVKSQVNGQPVRKFNRGALINAGFSIINSLGTYDSIIIHDVDLLPDRAIYSNYGSYPREIQHLANLWSRYDIEGINYFGGALAITPEDFLKTNGYPNHTWGWGGEDLNFKARLLQHNLRYQSVNNYADNYIDLEDITNISEKISKVKAGSEKDGQGISNSDFNLEKSDKQLLDRLTNNISGLNQRDWFEITGYHNYSPSDIKQQTIGIQINILETCYPYVGQHDESIRQIYQDHQGRLKTTTKQVEKLSLSKSKPELEAVNQIFDYNYLANYLSELLANLGYQDIKQHFQVENAKDVGLKEKRGKTTLTYPTYVIKIPHSEHMTWYAAREYILRLYTSTKMLITLLNNQDLKTPTDTRDLFKKVVDITGPLQRKGNLDFNYQVSYEITGRQTDKLEGAIYLNYLDKLPDVDEWDIPIPEVEIQNKLVTYGKRLYIPLDTRQQTSLNQTLEIFKELGDSKYQVNDPFHLDKFNEFPVVIGIGPYIIYYQARTDTSKVAKQVDDTLINLVDGDEVLSIKGQVITFKRHNSNLDLTLLTLKWKQDNLENKTSNFPHYRILEEGGQAEIARPTLTVVETPESPKYSASSPYFQEDSGEYSSASPHYQETSPKNSPTSPKYSPSSPLYQEDSGKYSSVSPHYQEDSK